MITDYHAKYFANELVKRCPSDSIEKLTASLVDAQVDLNPHQVEAALFAFRSPLSKGAILADEVGLGKTIEACIVLSQKWAERKRNILIIVPSSLRKQWNQELLDKFFLPSQIMEAKSFNQLFKSGQKNPFSQNEIIICSYQFARSKSQFVKNIRWDLVVIDEAHRLRNVYKTTNKIARTLKETLEEAPKILLTATPLQNTLMELYGLVSFIDEYAFGDLKSFKAQYSRLTSDDSFTELKQRLAPVCKRTLRRQVTEYIHYTNRIPITEEFVPSEDEQVLYDLVSEYLRRESIQALPASQRTLMTLVLRKLLASSTYAIAGALDALARKLNAKLKKDKDLKDKIDEEFSEEFETLDELKDELDEEETEELLTNDDIDAIKREIEDLTAFRELAVSITNNAKGDSLLKALKTGFKKAESLGASKKAIIFTESRRTQEYLTQLLSQSGFSNKYILFNGSNNDPKSKEVYQKWLAQYKDTDRYSGSKTADMRSALVDYFRDHAEIMIATEAAAEGINLQFCSLVVNFDLPWNPQRIEQRIGRSHRYGQKYDVVVINFLNKKNAADQRVYKLLDEKFKLFSGVFGASDEVLGAIESGVDFEKRIMMIYQNCRTTAEIEQSFDELQNELSQEIDENIKNTRKKLLENFDEEVNEKLKMNLKESRTYLNKYETLFWTLSEYFLKPYAEFIGDKLAFNLKENPFKDIKIATGLYTFRPKEEETAHHFRLNHTLAQNILNTYKDKPLEFSEVTFKYTGQTKKISILEPLIGKQGYLSLDLLTISSFDTEDYLFFTGLSPDGTRLDDEICKRLFSLPGTASNKAEFPETKLLDNYRNKTKSKIMDDLGNRNSKYFDEEMDKLDFWAEDKRNSLKTELKELDEEIKELKKAVRASGNLPDKLEKQKKLKTLNKKRDDAWKEYDASAKLVESQKDALIDNVEKKLKQQVTERNLFIIKWKLI